jgi:hypothetical protein
VLLPLSRCRQIKVAKQSDRLHPSRICPDFCRKMSFDVVLQPVETVCSRERMRFILQQTGRI